MAGKMARCTATESTKPKSVLVSVSKNEALRD
jgi:hypothetical protein